MRAAVFHGAREIHVEDVPAPQSPGARQVLLRPIWCGICGTDLHEYAQGPIVIPVEPHPLNGAKLPQILGHELSAEVVQVGPQVTSVKPGDRVSVMPLIVCGRCHYCVQGLQHLCTSMACTGLSSAGGGFAELVVVEEYQVAAVPESVSDIQASLVEPTAVAAYGCDRAGVGAGSTVLVTGFGPIGALAGIYATASGARVIVSEPNPARARFAAGLGLETVDAAADDVVEAIRESTGGLGVDAAIECSGNARALRTCIEVVRSRGTIAQTGLHTRPAEIDPMKLSLKDISLVGTWCYPIFDWPRVIELIATGRCPVERVVTSQIDLSDVVPSGFDRLLDPDGTEIKVIVAATS